MRKGSLPISSALTRLKVASISVERILNHAGQRKQTGCERRLARKLEVCRKTHTDCGGSGDGHTSRSTVRSLEPTGTIKLCTVPSRRRTSGTLSATVLP